MIAGSASSRSWKWTTLNEVATVITGTTPPTKDLENYGDAVPFVKPTELVDGPIHSVPQGLSAIGLKVARTAPPGAVLVSCIGVLGKTGIARTQVAFNQQINAIVFNEMVLPEFGLYYAQTLRPWLHGQASATTLPIVNKGKFQRAPFPLVTLEDQRRIVAEFEMQFSRLDEAVANLKRVSANLARQRAAVLNAAVVGHLTAQREPTWPRALNAGDPLPDGWRWLNAEELAAPEPGSIGAGPFGTIFKAKDFRSEGVPIIFLRHVAPMKYLQHKPGFMDTRKWEELFRPYSVFGGELLITKLGEPPGVCAMYPAGIGPAMVTPDVIKMRVDEDIAVPAYLMYYFNSEVAKRFATGAAFGTTRTRLTLPLFRDMPVVVPPLDEQHRIVAEVDRRFSIVLEVEAEVHANLKRAQVLRQAVLARAFAG